MRITYALAICLLAGLSSHVIADTISSEDLQTLINDDGKPETDDDKTTLSLSKFDPSLGTLTNVYVEIELSMENACIEMDNDADVAQEGKARVMNTAKSLISTVCLNKTDFTSINAGDMNISASQAFNLSATTGDTVGQFDLTNDTDYAIWEPGAFTSGDFGNIISSVWDDYKGTGNFTIDLHTLFLTSATVEGENLYFQGNSPDSKLYGKVIYTYDVPEPTTLALLGSGAVLLYRRKRR